MAENLIASWIDRVVAGFSPSRATRRVRDRAVLDHARDLRRSYDAARQDRLSGSWFRAPLSANASILRDGPKLRERSRTLALNNPWAKKIVAIYETFLGGMSARAVAGKDARGGPEAAEAANALWRSWSAWADADGITNFDGLLNIMVRALVRDGEVLVRRVRLPLDRVDPAGMTGPPLPFQIRVLEIDHLDVGRTEIPRGEGSRTVAGIRYDAEGRREGYWIHRDHPLDRVNPGEVSVFLPANDVLHLFEPVGPGVQRGVPWLAAAIPKLVDLDEYDEAELIAKKIAACFAAFVTSGESAEPIGEVEEGTDVEGRPERIETFRPGMVAYLGPGETVTTATPRDSGSFPDYMRAQLHALAASADVTYELLTGDLSQVNFSSGRMGLIQFRKRIERVQSTVLVPQVLVEIWDWFLSAALVIDALPPNVKMEVLWSPQRPESVQPKEDAEEEGIRLRNGTLSWREAVIRRGYDPVQLMAEMTEVFEAFDAAQLVFDSDPRRTDQSGKRQMDPEAALKQQAELETAKMAQSAKQADADREVAKQTAKAKPPVKE